MYISESSMVGDIDPIYRPTTIKATPQDIQDTVRILVEKGKSDPMICSTDNSFSSKPVATLSSWSGQLETFRWLVQQEYFEVDFEDHYRSSGSSIYHDLVTRMGDRGLLFISDALWSHTHVSRMRTMRDESGSTMLHLLLCRIGMSCGCNSKPIFRSTTLQKRMAQELVQAGSDVHARDHRGQSPLHVMLINMHKYMAFAYEHYVKYSDSSR